MKLKISILFFTLIPFLAFSQENTQILSGIEKTHPYILFSKKQEKRLKRQIKKDAYLKQLSNFVLKRADKIVETPLLEYHKDNRQTILNVSRSALNHIINCSMAFRLSGENKYKERAIAELLNVAGFVDWNPPHFLDVGEMSLAVAIGYDWLFDELTPQQRDSLAQAVHDKAFQPYFEAYQQGVWWTRTENNWNVVCNGGVSVAALSFARFFPQQAARVLRYSREKLPLCFENYAPQGVWYEGISYWGYATNYAVVTLAALESALNTDWGLKAMPGFEQTADFYVSGISPSMLGFNFADAAAETRPHYSPALFWLSREFDLPHVTQFYRKWLKTAFEQPESKFENRNNRFFALNLLWYSRQKDDVGFERLKTYKSRVDLAFFQAQPTSQSLYLAAKGGKNDTHHQQLDIGTFVVEAHGERWGVDMGSEHYHLPGFWDGKPGGQRWKYFRNTNKSHSTLVIGDQIQCVHAESDIIASDKASQIPYVVFDMTPAYCEQADSVLRAFRMLSDNTMQVRDQITGVERGENLRWAFVTKAEAEFDGNRATLRQNGKEFFLKIVEPENADFTRFSTRAFAKGAKDNSAYQIIGVKISAASPTAVFSVLLGKSKEDFQQQEKQALMPLEEWR